MAENEKHYVLGEEEVRAIRAMYRSWKRARGGVRFEDRGWPKPGTARKVVSVRITGVHSDSPGDDSTPHMFTGEMYNNGSRKPPTETDVTIAIAGIPPGFKNFPDFPQNAVGTRQSWTGASGDAYVEKVYEVEIPWPVFVYQVTSTSDESIEAKPVDSDGNTVGDVEIFGTYDVTV